MDVLARLRLGQITEDEAQSLLIVKKKSKLRAEKYIKKLINTIKSIEQSIGDKHGNN